MIGQIRRIDSLQIQCTVQNQIVIWLETIGDDHKANDLLPECILLKVAGGVIWPNEISLPCSSLDLIPDFELLPQELKLMILSLLSLV